MRHVFVFIIVSTLLIASDLMRGFEAINQGNFPLAKNFLQKACDGGNAKGCFGLGLMYYRGDGVEQDYSNAAMLYRKACDGGEMGGCFNLATMYDVGTGVQQSKSYAKKLFKIVCDTTRENGCAEYELLVSQGH